ncbi:MAG: SPASM domain-containing protein [Arcobacter sp.]|nr:SPASM domain-containing protein [Arcobacter sp.]
MKYKIHSFINLRLWNLDKENSENTFNNKVFKILEQYFKISLENAQDTKQIRLENQVLLHFDNYFEWPNMASTQETNGYCKGLSSHFGILSSGIVVPCCLDGFGDVSLGNLKNETLENILNKEKTNNIISGFKSNIALEELCKKCTYKDRFQIK